MTIIETKTPREELIQNVKNRIMIEKTIIKRLQREIQEHKRILRILYKSLEMLKTDAEKK